MGRGNSIWLFKAGHAFVRLSCSLFHLMDENKLGKQHYGLKTLLFQALTPITFSFCLSLVDNFVI